MFKLIIDHSNSKPANLDSIILCTVGEFKCLNKSFELKTELKLKTSYLDGIYASEACLYI